jgi:very-short-patch-repair endonuclease
MRALASIHLHGVVSRGELLAAGVGRRAIAYALRSGRLHAKYEGVYAVGRPDLSVEGERRAIVLACGDGAVLGRRSAAAMWGLRPDAGRTWEVIIPATANRAPNGPVRVLRMRLAADEITHLDGIPVTTVARTLIDLAAVVAPHHLRRAVERAVELELFDLKELERLLARHARRPGTPKLRALLADLRAHGMTMTRSDAEAAMVQICIDRRLPRPLVNRFNNGREADFRWPDRKLIVEVDGYGPHRSLRAFSTDRAKDRTALRDGWRTARFTAHEVEHRPERVGRELAALLAA